MKRIKLMADYYCWPLWWAGDSAEDVGNIAPESLPLSPSTVERLRRWAEAYDEGLDLRDPASSEWPEDKRAEFAAEGERLWALLRQELSGQYEVLYFDEKTGRLLQDPSQLSG